MFKKTKHTKSNAHTAVNENYAEKEGEWGKERCDYNHTSSHNSSCFLPSPRYTTGVEG